MEYQQAVKCTDHYVMGLQFEEHRVISILRTYPVHYDGAQIAGVGVVRAIEAAEWDQLPRRHPSFRLRATLNRG